MDKFHRIDIVDSHTGGEPTRVVLAGAPDLGRGNLADQLRVLREERDWFRSAVINEPRGSSALVGALLRPSTDASCAAGVIFFNNIGYIGMCGHGAIGLAVTLAHLRRLAVGPHRFETPVGMVQVQLHNAQRVSVTNVPSFRYRKGLVLKVPEIGDVKGDVAWGGNWFFILSEHGQALELENVGRLTNYAGAIRRQLDGQGVRGPAGELIDHVELCGPPSNPELADGSNFVLCPGNAYDRSPCGTGTSAKLACLIEDGQLSPGAAWRQQGITGSVFEARGQIEDGRVVPTVTGSAHITAEATLLLDPDDPLVRGLGGKGQAPLAYSRSREL